MPRKSIEQDKNTRERIVQSSSSADETRMLSSESNESGLEQQDVGNKGSNPEPETPLAQDLRPRRFKDYVGQKAVVDSISIAVLAAKKRGDTLDHALFHGPPGLGKTTISHIIARELDSTLVHTSGPALERPADVVGLLSNLKPGDVLFIDEIHRLSHAVEEYLYSAMEDFRVDFMTGSGAFAKSINLPLMVFC